VAAAGNAVSLLHDAEVLRSQGCRARALALAVMCVEECGKALSLAALAMLPGNMRGYAPVGRMLSSHEWKLAGGLLVSVVTAEKPGVAARLAMMPSAKATAIVAALSLPAEEAEREKRRSLYVDLDQSGRVSEPCDITEDEVDVQLGRAMRACESARALLGPEAQERLANPPAEAAELAQAMAAELAGGRGKRLTPRAGVRVMVNAVRRLQARLLRRDRDVAGYQQDRSAADDN
jgi:AbiV family abortive infection protein